MPAIPTKATEELRELIRHDLFGEPRDDVRWASRQVAPPRAQQRFVFGACAAPRTVNRAGG